MKKSKNALKILLLQIRDDEATLSEEFYGFVQSSHLQPQQLTTLNAFHDQNFEPEIINNYDALFVGGSSDACVLFPDRYPFVNRCKQMIRYCYDVSKPVFASCFGFQLIIEEFGGKVIHDEKNMELGMMPVQLTNEAKQDVLLKNMPNSIWSIMGHKFRASELPEGIILLGYTKACPYQLIKFADKPIYASQFHPEMSKADFHTRIERYIDRYLGEGSDDMDRLKRDLDAITETTQHANNLMANFVDRIILA